MNEIKRILELARPMKGLLVVGAALVSCCFVCLYAAPTMPGWRAGALHFAAGLFIFAAFAVPAAIAEAQPRSAIGTCEELNKPNQHT